MPHFTYLPGPDEDETTRAFGYSFAAGEWTLIPAENHHALAKLRVNRFFQERDGSTESNIPLGAAYPNAIADKATELHETGDTKLSARESLPVDITPQQCRAARAWLDWSREELAKQAKIAERTITDFERGAKQHAHQEQARPSHGF